MQQLNRANIGLTESLPIKVVQFGEGNFLRAFVDYAIQRLNKEAGFNAGIAVVQPIDRGMVSMLNDQDGLYTLFSKGIKEGQEVEEKELITNIVKGIDPYADFHDFLDLAKEEQLQFIISNTTEAGIAYAATDTRDMRPPSSYPAKLTVLLHERYRHFDGAQDKGLTIIPCELINYNSDTLKKIILDYIGLWKLEEGFKNWVLNACTFHNTLVDRIVPGYPRDQIEAYNAQLDYGDKLLVSAETFFLWVIEGDDRLKQKLPFHKTGLDVKIVKDMQPFRTRKVRILNGAHTAMVPISILYGNQTVKESVDEKFTGPFIQSVVFDEIIPTLDMDKAELEAFAKAVFDRFRNPFIKHQLASIALNSISKFKVRVLPSLLEFVKRKNSLPVHMVFAFACLIRFYKGDFKGRELPVNDDSEIVAEMAGIWQSGNYDAIAEKVLSKTEYWGEDLTKIKDLRQRIAKALQLIDEDGISEGFIAFKNI
ncbi:tagaturonate reductase [Maribacter polysiphoniae]|uniref:Tagaturonate reductase n=1 Tax=Maribacter polysiphoniae TaxID=429344 RepID=A0A316E6L6_9FLAO|nr:tagaturonate reductase [Maribacter polysiphoniae]MBD1262352.1 tagaturonate reductase [Maribacter polysiphoniae]PWK26051.1 tagaturonate reductase [Maribacter polysiphoniae]